MHFKFQSILALAALVPLTIGSPLLRRAIPQNILSDLSAIDAAANAATAAANALPNNATPNQIGAAVNSYSALSNAFAKAAQDIAANGPLSNDDANTLFFVGPEAFVADVVQALGIITADASTKLANPLTHPPFLTDFSALEGTFSSFRTAVTVATRTAPVNVTNAFNAVEDSIQQAIDRAVIAFSS